MYKRLSMCFVLSLLIVLSGCSFGNTNKKTTITIMYYNEMNHFIDLVESKYDDIEIEYEQSTLGRFNSDGERRVRNGHGMDLLLTTMPDGEMKDYVSDLSSYEFSTRYQSSIMSSVKRNGETVFLPMPGNYYGYIINQSLVEKMGQKLPTTQQEFLDLLRLSKKNGIGAGEDGSVFGVDNVAGDALGNFLIGTAIPDYLGTINGEAWIDDFLNHKVTFKGSMGCSMDFFLTLTKEGLMDSKRLDSSRNVVDVKERLSNGKMLACYGTSLYLAEIQEANKDYVYTMLPFFSSEGNPAWVSSSPSSYIAINKELGEIGEN